VDVLRKKILIAIVILLALLVPLWPGFERSAAPMDEGSLLVYPELILKGKLPYRDFETFYGPANLWVLSAAYAGFGPSIFVERAVGLIYRILILAAVFALVQRWSITLAIGCALITGFLLLPISLGAFAWTGGAMCTLWSIWMITRIDSRACCFFGGILAGLALLFRPDLGPAAIFSGLPLFLLMTAPRRWIYLGGAGLALLPLAWLAAIAGPGEILNNLLLYPVIYSNPSRRLSIFLAEEYLVCLFIAHIVAVTTNIFAGVLSLRANRRDPGARLLLGLALFGLCLTHQAAQRIDLAHVIFAVFVPLGLLPLSIFVIQSHLHAAIPRWRDALLAAAIVLLLLQSIAPELAHVAHDKVLTGVGFRTKETHFIAEHGRSFPVSSMQTALSFGKMFDRLNTLASPGERLFVGPADLRRTNYNHTFVYHMMPQLRPATYFLEMNPQSANRPNSRLAADIATADWLVLDHDTDNWNEKNDSAKFGSDLPMQVVAQQFELCGRYGSCDLYRRKHAPPEGLPDLAGLLFQDVQRPKQVMGD
jgi:hypothetical protein